MRNTTICRAINLKARLNDEQLIKELKDGRESAYQYLVDSFQEKVLNTCLGFVPNQQDAEDLVQEVFVKIFRSIHQFRGEAKLSTWVYQVAVRECLQLLRYRKRQKRVAYFQSLIGLEERADRLTNDQFDHPGVLLENKERAQVLFEQINTLSENQRIAFTLHRLEGLSYKEIAAIMELSVSSIESLLFRAKKNLQKKLGFYYREKII